MRELESSVQGTLEGCFDSYAGFDGPASHRAMVARPVTKQTIVHPHSLECCDPTVGSPLSFVVDRTLSNSSSVEMQDDLSRTSFFDHRCRWFLVCHERPNKEARTLPFCNRKTFMLRSIIVGILAAVAWASVTLAFSNENLLEDPNGDFKFVFALLLGSILGAVTGGLHYARQRSRGRAAKYKREKRAPKIKFPEQDRVAHEEES